MSRDILSDRKKSLEEAFFRKAEEKKLTEYKDDLEKQKSREELAALSGLNNDDVLGTLVEAGVSGETMAALALVPLVQVAWADDELDDSEREAILRAAENKGIKPDTPASSLLGSWLDTKPPDELFAAWSGYIGALDAHLDADQVDQLRTEIVEFAREVARAAGGFLGIGSISKDEERALDEIANAFPKK